MLTGEGPFLRNSAAETLGAILKETPPALDAAHMGAPPDLVSRLQHVLDKCLAKDREQRYQTTKDLTLDLQWILRDSDSGEAPSVGADVIQAPALRGALPGRLADRGRARSRVLAPRGAGPSPRQPRSGHHGHRDRGGSHVVAGIRDAGLLPGSGRLFRQHRRLGDAGRERAAAQSHCRSCGGGLFSELLSGRPSNRLLLLSRRRGLLRDAGARRPATKDRRGVDDLFDVEAPVVFRRQATCLRRPRRTSPTAAVVSLDTGESRRVPLPGRNVNGRLDLAWSSDGRHFAYVDTKSDLSQIGQILVLGVEEGTTSEVTDGRTNVASPTWSRDSRDLYYVSNRAGSMDLWRQRMRGRPTRRGSAAR